MNKIGINNTSSYEVDTLGSTTTENIKSNSNGFSSFNKFVLNESNYNN
jgi:hypothetical protein